MVEWLNGGVDEVDEHALLSWFQSVAGQNGYYVFLNRFIFDLLSLIFPNVFTIFCRCLDCF